MCPDAARWLAVNAPATNVVAVGVFDGVHRGHLRILDTAVELARNNGVALSVVTFEPHPDAVLGKTQPRPPLTPVGEKRELLSRAGAERVEILHFDRQMAGMEPESFVRRYLIEPLGMTHLVAGVDFALGKNRVGDMSYLRELGKRVGFGVEAVPLLQDPDGPVSSTRIREFLSKGSVADVARLLGRLYRIEAQVVTGRGLGRELGFPTANLELLEHQALPGDGIYAVWVQPTNGDCHQGALSIGIRPAVGGGPRTVEVHVLDYQGELYGNSLTVDFVEWIREERNFPDLQALSRAIAADVESTREILARDRPRATSP
jgi:riboflavin kinase/FMN adenylyltransferase